MRKKKLVLLIDLLFLLQIISAVIFGFGQLSKTLTTTAGISLSWYLCWQGFQAINITLGIRAWRKQETRATKWEVGSYCIWALMVCMNWVIALCLGKLTFTQIDTLTLQLVLGAFAILGIGSLLTDRIHPVIKKMAPATVCKTIPQLTLAWYILHTSGQGLSALTIITVYATCISRLILCWITCRETHWEHNRVAIGLSEVGSLLSWSVVTIVWIHTS